MAMGHHRLAPSLMVGRGKRRVGGFYFRMCIVGVALRPDGTKVPVMSWSEWLLKPLYRNDMPSNGSPRAGE